MFVHDVKGIEGGREIRGYIAIGKHTEMGQWTRKTCTSRPQPRREVRVPDPCCASCTSELLPRRSGDDFRYNDRKRLSVPQGCDVYTNDEQYRGTCFAPNVTVTRAHQFAI